MLTLLAGLGLGLSLIIAIGAQNVFVLRQGIRREHVLVVVLICALSDAALIVAGVGGLGLMIEAMPWLVPVARWSGALFLLGYGVLAARRALRGEDASLHVADAVSVAPQAVPHGTSPTAVIAGRRTATKKLLPVALTALALTWLNPHVYLDTVLLLGSIAATHGDDRWIFAAGAVLASAIWFTALGFGARYVSRWLDTPRSWRILDAAISVVMIALAVSLVMPLLTT